MANYFKITIGGTEYTESVRCLVRKNINTRPSMATISFKNKAGDKKTDFGIGEEIIVYYDTVTPLVNRIFVGRVEDVSFSGESNSEEIEVYGRDYSSFLMDVHALENYTSQEISTIITDLLDKYAPGLTYTNVQVTSKTLPFISFKRRPVWECIKELAGIVEHDFWVDEDKDLHFAPSGSVSSGFVADNTNIVRSSISLNNNDMFNKIWVYGDKYLSGWIDTFTADGAGSTYTLSYKPHNCEVKNAGTIQRGAIFEMTTAIPVSTDYFVDYDEQKIIFVSGPTSGNAVSVAYDRGRPIIKMSEDGASQSSYGVREKVIENKEIKDPQQAVNLAKAELAVNKDPKRQGNIVLNTTQSFSNGNTIVVDLPWENVNSETFLIQEAIYNLTTDSLQKGEVVTLRIGEHHTALMDNLRQVVVDIKRLQAYDIDTDDVFTRLVNAVGSVGVKSQWYVRSRGIGSSYRLDDDVYGLIEDAAGAEFLGVLGDDSDLSYSVLVSGGTW